MRVALVTGATGGLGLAVTTALGDAGWTVVSTDRPATAADIEEDLRDGGAAERIVAGALALHGRLDLLVNNAATMYHGPLDLDDLDRWWDTIDVNLSAPFRLARAAAPALLASGGQIINVASTHGVMAEAGFSAYCTAKAGVIGLTKALALELAPGVRVNAIAPGHIDTPQQDVDAEAAGLTREELFASYRRSIPLQRILTAAEVARTLCFLAGEPGYTGACLHLNGGALLV